MNVKRILTMMLVGLGIIPATRAQSFDHLWKQTEKAVEEDLPQTAIELTDRIFEKGQQEKNSAQMLKAYMWRMKYKQELVPDSFYTQLKGLEQWALTTNQPTDRAVLYSIVADIYADYAQRNYWQLRKRADITGQAAPDDIREWTSKQFVDTVKTCVRNALADSAVLLRTSSKDYIPFVEQRESSEYYHHDLYHLIAMRGIESLKQLRRLTEDDDVASASLRQTIQSVYLRMLAAYETAKNDEGYVLTMLDYLSWKHQYDPDFRPFRATEGKLGLTQDPYVAGLNQLLERFKANPICAEVYLAKAEYAEEKGQYPIALQLYNEAIGRYASYPRINSLKSLRESILQPSLTVRTYDWGYPGTEVSMVVSHKNLDGFTIRFYTKGKKRKMVQEQHYSLVRPADYSRQDTSFTFTAPAAGEYVCRIVPDTPDDGKAKEQDFRSTKLRTLTATLPDGQYEAIVLDGQSGHPVSDATVTLYDDNDESKKALQTFVTGKDGRVVFPWKEEYSNLQASKGTDISMLQYVSRRNGLEVSDDDEANESVTLLTDRSLYRPGQTVYVKGIAYTHRSDTAHVLANKEYTVTLRDVNDQEVGKKSVRTNEFGSFTTDFALPAACLNGSFLVETEEGSREIRVEEYKRPTFDITFDKLQDSYRIGDRVTVAGKVQSFSGVALQDLPVKYTVKRSTFNYWRIPYDSSQILSGEVTADGEGKFSIPVLLEEEVGKDRQHYFYSYTVEATVTNAAGETQSATSVVVAGERPLVLQVELPQWICKDSPLQKTFQVVNLNGQAVEAEVAYSLYTDDDSDTARPVASGTVAANREAPLDWSKVPSGSYLLKMQAKDAQGRTDTLSLHTALFAASDRRLPKKAVAWHYNINTEFDAAHPAEVCFGTSEKDLYVLMRVFCGKKMIENKALTLSDTIVRFRWPYQESYGDGLLVKFCTVRGGQVYEYSSRLAKRLPDKKLAMKWEVFRDKLRPGQQEEWKLTIRTPQGQPAEAEMLALMYDASLDKLWKRPQNFWLGYRRNLPYFSWSRDGGSVLSNWFYPRFKSRSFNISPLRYDRFLEVDYAARRLLMTRASTGVFKKVRASTDDAVFDMAEMPAAFKSNSALQEVVVVNQTAAAPVAPDLPEAPATLRTNLSETAFFYPQLRTNKEGEIILSFTMPESLTRWNFNGYAHTKDMMQSTLDATATTSKEFMLVPNLPRFVRVGDRTSLAASLSNLTGQAQAGTVTLTLFDPVTEKVLDTQQQSFSVEAGKTVGISFGFTATAACNVLGCRLVADGGAFSDGEQQLLPVLGNTQHLVETLPLPVRGTETRTFALDSLFNRRASTATDRKLTIEFTGNPAWYAVQALPSLNLPESDNALAWATALYANTLASFITNSQPRLKAVFDSWKLQGGSSESFLGNLQKNQDVKNLLLAESPWVLEAQTEQQQRERIATLFDLNRIGADRASALAHLQELQEGDTGAWPWFKGMNGSPYVTGYIVRLNVRLALLTGKPLEGDALVMQQKAFAYLHRSALKEYEDMLKAHKERGIPMKGLSGQALEYLYLIALSGEPVPEANRAAYDYFLSQVGKLLPVSSMYTKAQVAVVLSKAGRKDLAQKFVASLKEYLTKTDELGMFFAFNEKEHRWGSTHLQVHVAVMEALSLAGGNDAVVEEMKIWLLKQKQTQQWDSPVTTADAVYALLMRGTDLLAAPAEARIRVGGETITTDGQGATVPGLGYVKRSFTEKNVVDARTLTVQKQSAGIAWGAVYATYESPLADVQQQGSGLEVEKQLYVERQEGNAKQLQPLAAGTPLRVGDRVVSRLVIRVDRALDFVQLKDQRAACLEPVGNLSGYRWSDGIGYYVDVKDASTCFFFDGLSKGVYVLEHSSLVSRAGTYEAGIATVQCAYAPEYAAHSASMTVKVEQ